ncbi:alkaline protease secretion ATP-binding protein AprD [Ramlibacter solisilvae]|uniref:Peptidase n=1 Tax=Ramlibacter tataouinensis TaxID=94132 RepID=A0A127JVB6_9BURK|nr:type I secretion system permease/ATPase [Ramlibacter tataouinensis]AMO23844.1 peptidase [Ramlibacter tataouinensis]
MKTPTFFQRSELAATLWSFRREFAIVGLFSAVANLLMLTPTIYMLQVYDRVLVSHSELTLLAVSLICLFLFAVMAMSEWTRSRLLVRTGVRLDEQLGTRVFNASFEAYLDSSGLSPQRAFNDLLQVRQFLTGQGIFAFFDAPWTPIYIAVSFALHPLLGILAIVFAIVQVGLAWFGHRHTVAPSEEAVKANLEVNLFLQGKLRNSETLEAMGMVRNLQQRWRERHVRALARQTQSQAVSNRVTAWSKFVRYSQQSLSLGAGALLVIDGQLSPGAMIAANVLMNRALAPIDMMVSSWRSFIGARAAFERLEKLLGTFPERDPALTRVAPTGEITLRGVEATAPRREAPILKKINFAIPAGTVVAVLGPSGSGKSTLARTLVGIWPDVSGEVLLDGSPIEGWNRLELGPHLGYLPQDVELFDGTIAENIARFSEIDSEKVITAARITGLHESILRFPKGYDTPIGEAGSVLSGGQRQRIALARAVYGDPALVVLDEPNANLDDAGEAALMNAVAQLKAKGKTVFIVSHRPGALAVADWILALNNGEVVANGPRDLVTQFARRQHMAAQSDTGSGPLPPQPA